MEMYLDLECVGLNPEIDKIITIQYKKINDNNSELIILKEWESSEEEILIKFHKIFFGKSNWDFIPIMVNSPFDLKFLFTRFKKYGLNIPSMDDYLYSKPIIDIKPILILINNFSFKGWGLNNLTDKKTDGSHIPKLYSEKKYNEIEEYIKQETESFLYAFDKIKKHLRGLNLKDGN